MKVCPICDARYDEEIIRFCTKDGTPLVDEIEPSFIEMPSENLDDTDDDIGEITVIRRKDAVPLPPPIDDFDRPSDSRAAERIVIPTTPTPREQDARPRTTQAYYPPLQQSNTMKVVALTIFGTIAVLGLGAGLFWFLQKEKPSNSNVNLNTNLGSFNGNLNSNTNLNSFNFNTNANYNSNFNTNFNIGGNLKTPTPTPKPTPNPSPSPSASPDESPTPTPAAGPNTNTRPPANVRPTPVTTPRIGPRPTPLPTNRPPGNEK